MRIGPMLDRDPERKAHGEVSVGIGAAGYRSVCMRSDFPIGETGTLSVAVEDTRFGRRSGFRVGRGFGADLPLGAASGFASDRRRCDLEGLTPPRPLDRIGGPNRCCARHAPRR